MPSLKESTHLLKTQFSISLKFHKRELLISKILSHVVIRENRIKNFSNLGFPGGTVVENLPANAGDTGSRPGLGRSHMPDRKSVV